MKRALKNLFIIGYRIWYYLLVMLSILLLFPVLIISILKASWYPLFFRVARIWARIILFGMGFIPKVKRSEEMAKGRSVLYVANHTSMTDIMLMLHVTNNPFVFVGKAELAKIPLFGFFYKRTCILVDRGNARSRHNVFLESQKRLQRGLSVCIFPEGGVPDDELVVLDTFKDGAFRLAIEHQIPIVPMTFHDNKRRFPYSFFKGGPGRMRAVVHKTVATQGLQMEDKRALKDQVRDTIWKELQHPSIP
ncbi:lysophospholipid acyltransferase family protein [Altibacter sp. HG106]|uniref:lysophospholipid acyltransferase family protein n=1 Tax=Altibacter sp. HG106 TaxID=3023937 RepID=UPI0023506904|nr:lysophospholipid acyltransferase family protein [Altibacter sp. HG106]MDC7995045.1 lysophospholipid acyltransferase family protein [Altibacter sp. HG106]